MAPGSPYDSTRTKLADAWRHRAVSLKALSFGVIGIFNNGGRLRRLPAGARGVYEGSAIVLTGLAWVSHACACGRPETILLVAANITSWLVAVTGSYIMNSSITFAAESGRKLRWRDYLTFVVSGIAD